MEPINLQPIVDKIYATVQKHRLAAGSYTRLPTETLPNPYGCADAANILYTIGAFPKDESERSESVRILQSMQDPMTGLFTEGSGDPACKELHIRDFIHTTAHCIAALELFDATPLYPVVDLEHYLEEDAFLQFTEKTGDCSTSCFEPRQTAGLFVVLNMSGYGTEDFNERYFRWMWDNVDPETGFWRIGCPNATQPVWKQIAGSFHYLFSHEYAHMPLRYPDKVIDSCISMHLDTPPEGFGETAGFMEIDWIYCMTRAMEQTPHRFYEARECLKDFTEKFVTGLMSADWDTDPKLNDLHALFGTVCAFAELQRTLRGKLITKLPLRLVLDKRLFA